jgi:preprotein translocase subunit SecD
MINATIFNPTDNNLEAKVKSVRDVQKAYHGVKASLKISKANGYNSALGTEEELKEALEISQNSYNQAIKSLSEGELKKARKENLLSTEEFQKLSIEKHKTKVQVIRSEQKNKSHTKDHSHKK